MKRKTLRIPLTIITVLVFLFIGGIAYVIYQPSNKVSTPATGSVVHLTDYTNNDGTQSTIILSGAVGDFGKAVSTYANGKSDPQHNADLTLDLAHGSFRLAIASLTKQFTAAISKLQFNQSTCSGSTSVTGSVPIVSGSGTGAYQRISGNFKLTATLDEVVPKQPNCNADGTMLEQAIVITGWGTVSEE